MITRLIMFLYHIEYKRYGLGIFFIKGHGNHYPKYLLYTENENIYNKFDNI